MASVKQKAAQSKIAQVGKRAAELQKKSGVKKTVTKTVYNMPWKEAVKKAAKEVYKK